MLSGTCGAVQRGEERSGAGGGAVPSGKVKEAVLYASWGAVPSGKVKEAVLCGAGGAMASGKVK